MKEILNHDGIVLIQKQRFADIFKRDGTSDECLKAFYFAWDLGREFAEDYPKWMPNNKHNQPKNGDRILAYLDDDTIATYTYYNNNKELVQLFKNHVIAWMYQPKKPIFKQ